MATEFCYSTNEEEYRGRCSTVDEAHSQAIDDLESEANEGEERHYWIAEVAHPIDVCGADWLAKTAGECVEENFVMWCDENVGSEEPCLDISKEDRKELGEMIVKFFREKSAIQYYGINNPIKHRHVVGSDRGEPATANFPHGSLGEEATV